MKEIKIKFATLLATAFVILKLTNVIDWPWIWVLSPIWIDILITIIIATFLVISGYSPKSQEEKDAEEIEAWQKKLREKYGR